MTRSKKELPEEQEPSEEQIFLEKSRIIYEAVTSKHVITKQSELYKFIYALTGEQVPFEHCCPNHCTPWDMIWEAYKVDLPQYKGQVASDIVAVGPREGYKTLSTAKLIAAELLLKPNVDIASIGAIVKQASRCYKYASKYIFHPVLAEMAMVTKNIMEETTLSNGSRYEQLVANISGVNSPHPQKLRADEVELMKIEVVEEMKMVPSSYNGWKAHTLYTSTRKFVEGVMSDLISKAGREGRNSKTMIWCYKDVSEPCPDERSGINQKIYEIEDIFHSREKLVVQAYEYCGDCPILPSCRGDLKRAKGNIPIDDSIKKWNELDRDTWLAQKESVEPSRTSLFYCDWDDKLNTGDFSYDPKYPADMFFDFTGGGEDPTVMQIWQTKDDCDYLVKEMVYRYRSTPQVGEEIETWCRGVGVKPTNMKGDSSQMQQIRDLRSSSAFFNNLRPVRKIDRKEGFSLCRRRLRDNNGKRKTFIDHSCINFQVEIRNYKRRSTDPDDAKDGNDHSMDCWRYRTVDRYYMIGEPRVRILSADYAEGEEQEYSALDKPERIIPKDGQGIYNQIDEYLRSED